MFVKPVPRILYHSQQVTSLLTALATLEQKGQTGAHVQHVTLENTKYLLAMHCVLIVKVANIQQWSVLSRMFVKPVPQILCRRQQVTSLLIVFATWGTQA